MSDNTLRNTGLSTRLGTASRTNNLVTKRDSTQKGLQRVAESSKITKAAQRSVQKHKELQKGVGGETIPDDPRAPKKNRRKPRCEKAPEYQPSDPNRSRSTISEPELLQLESQMRSAVRKARPIHETEEHLLLSTFRAVDDGSGGIDVHEFIQAWSRLHLDLSWEQVTAMYVKHWDKVDSEGALRFVQFTKALLKGANRTISQEPVCMGYPVKDEDFRRKIVYPRCRKGVLAPSDFPLSLADRSTFQPDAQLHLSFVFGYDGTRNTAGNLFYTCEGLVVYYVAAVCVVYDKMNHTQKFFLGHNDDIKCISICPAAVTYKGVEYPPLSLVASGQVKPVEDKETEERECPFLIIWDVRTCTEVARVCHDENDRAVVAAAFSPCGARLATVTCDDAHTVRVWEWRRKDVGLLKPSGRLTGVVGEGKGYRERPIAVYGVVWNPFVPEDESEHFVTFGMKHIKVWSVVNGRWLGFTCKFGSLPIDHVLSALFLTGRNGAPGLMLTGMPSGDIYFWRNGAAIKSVRAHAKGPEIISPTGAVTYGGVRCLRLKSDHRTLLSGGADGVVRGWDVGTPQASEGKSLGTELFAFRLSRTDHTKGPPPAVRALDCEGTSGDVFIAGTDNCDIWEVDKDPEPLVFGHSGPINCVAPHPTKPQVFASVITVGSLKPAGRVMLWHADMRTLIRSASVRYPCKSCAFSCGALGINVADDSPSHHLAVGGEGGRLLILEEGTFATLFSDKWASSALDVLKYSPDNKYLAVGSHDFMVDIYLVRSGRAGQYERHKRCAGHSSTVTQMDWSVDSRVLQSNDQSYEALHWDPVTGRKVPHSQHNQSWSTWTCTLGFPVMGIWQAGNDGTDVNSVCRSKSEQYLVTADDHSCVRLYYYPCVVESAPNRLYRGHSSHVTSVRFTCDDRRVLSSGGVDQALLLFETHGMMNTNSADQGLWEWRRGKRQTLPYKHPQCDLPKCKSCGERGPPPKPPMVWGPKDSEGKLMGWIQPPTPQQWPDDEGEPPGNTVGSEGLGDYGGACIETDTSVVDL